MRNVKALKLATGFVLAAAPLATISGLGVAPAMAATVTSHRPAAHAIAMRHDDTLGWDGPRMCITLLG